MSNLARIRLHRGGLGESLATAGYITPNVGSVALFLGLESEDGIEVRPYGIDARLGGMQNLVFVNGYPEAWIDQCDWPVHSPKPLT